MTSINKFNGALDILKRTLAEKPSTKHTAASRADSGQETSHTGASDRNQQVHRRIKNRLMTLNLDQLADQERGATVFLETILANKFGAELLDDPAVYNMIADVKNTMFADQSTQANLIAVLVEIKGSN